MLSTHTPTRPRLCPCTTQRTAAAAAAAAAALVCRASQHSLIQQQARTPLNPRLNPKSLQVAFVCVHVQRLVSLPHARASSSSRSSTTTTTAVCSAHCFVVRAPGATASRRGGYRPPGGGVVRHWWGSCPTLRAATSTNTHTHMGRGHRAGQPLSLWHGCSRVRVNAAPHSAALPAWANQLRGRWCTCGHR